MGGVSILPQVTGSRNLPPGAPFPVVAALRAETQQVPMAVSDQTILLFGSHSVDFILLFLLNC